MPASKYRNEPCNLSIKLPALRVWIRDIKKRYYYNTALHPMLEGMILDLARAIAANTSHRCGVSLIYDYLKDELDREFKDVKKEKIKEMKNEFKKESSN